MTKISSGFRTLFLVYFIFGLVFGLIYLFIPGVFLGSAGQSVQDVLPYRVIGAAILALAASSWYCRQSPEWERVKIVVLAYIVWSVLNVLIHLYGLIFVATPSSYWLNVILEAGFAGAFIYFYIKK